MVFAISQRGLNYYCLVIEHLNSLILVTIDIIELTVAVELIELIKLKQLDDVLNYQHFHNFHREFIGFS